MGGTGFRVAVLGLLMVWLAACIAPAVFAQIGNDGWTAPVVLFQYETGTVRWPSITADAFGRLHVVWSYEDDKAGVVPAIYYSQWDGTVWSQPVDILLSPDSGAIDWVRVTVDDRGQVHIVWRGGGRLCHRSASVVTAITAHAWTSSRGGCSEQILMADVAAGSDGTLHLVYARTGSNVFYVRSTDGGDSWSAPVAVSDVASNTATDHLSLTLDDQNNIHVVWSQWPLPEAYPPLGVYYARSSDGGETWTQPLEIVKGQYAMPSIASTGETIHIVWDGASGIHGRYHSYSLDGGRTWSEPRQIVPGIGGLSFFPELAVDSAGMLYLGLAASEGNLYGHWDGSAWVDLRQIRLAGIEASGQGAPLDAVIGPTDLAVSEGNKLHMIFVSAGAIWYTRREVPAPYVPPQPMPPLTLTLKLTATPTVTLSPTPTATSRPTTIVSSVSTASGPSGSGFGSPLTPVVAGLLPTILVVGIVVLVRVFRIGRY